MVTFALQALPDTAAGWLDTARRAEEAGFESLYVADHPGSCAAPFVALAAAAAVTSRIRLGSYVTNAGVREPMLIAVDVATLDVVSDGRAVLGLGAGHTPAEWAAVGRVRPAVRGRIDHCIAVAEAATRMLAGEGLERPRPVQEKVPLLIGGGNTRLLRWAASHADLIGLSGLGRTLDDGHSHETRWRREQVDAQVELCGGIPVEALVQRFEVTDDAGAAYSAYAKEVDADEDDLIACPYVLAGTLDEIAAKLRDLESRWGITRFAVRRPALDGVAELLRTH
ncbi:LLM class F420-dependent oxidoreductase [Paractinoplanes abujensis]|uniref:Putative F420-dependent oxidoreductase n=1 Tax=Paractinoplanes abujensis TaxID=882441 RepID=A0A7W7CUS9_9ACTN|nr:LLM class flavin-dependent oxidoreductase [Actinoplanes abujensis]MBB4695070.1 putative F420-dependent oxidoreductase [Actinoplanes abujensis]GID23801.1 LLM class F420-dependent oxidoreductase [Actinoplanes abujensis]